MQGTLPRQKIDVWQELKDLDFLSSFFSWFFMLLTRLSEPLMLLSTLYVVAETGVPAITTPVLHNLSIGIMITAPEIILPGAFVVASRSKQHAGWLYTVCWTFVVLTLLTLVSLFVWHFTGQSLAWLMCARCATAVGYSILMRVMSHGRSQVQVISVPDVLAHLSALSLQAVQPAMLDTIRADISAKMNRLEQSVGQKIATLSVPKSVSIPAYIVPVSEQFGSFENGSIQPGYQQDFTLIEQVKPIAMEPVLSESKDQKKAPFEEEQKPQSEQTASRRTMTIEEVVNATGLTERRVKNLIQKRTLKVSPRNPQLILISSVDDWLKITANDKETTELPMVQSASNNRH